MPPTKSTLALEGLRTVLDQALSTSKGIEIECASRPEAINLRGRLNKLRSIDRERSKKAYPEDHPLWGCSEWDILIVKLPDKPGNVVRIEKQDLSGFEIKEIA